MVLPTVFGTQQQINMANWTVSTSTQSKAQGATVSTSVVLTIVPASGYVISASQFKIGGASNTSGNIWAGGNVDIGVNTVTFADTGTAGTVGNTVTATVAFDSFTMPSSNKTLYIDIDEVSSDVDRELRPICIRTYHTLQQDENNVDVHTVTTTSPTGITQSDNSSTTGVTSALSSTGEAQVRYFHQGTVPEGVAAPGSLIMTKVFAANTTYAYFYTSVPTYVLDVNSYANYTNYYTVTETGHTYNSDNELTAVTFKLYYNPPVNPDQPDPDPFSSAAGMCETGQGIIFSHDLRQKEGGGPGDTLNVDSVVTDEDTYIPHDGITKQVTINGDVGTKFRMTITSSDSSKTYNFSTNKFTATATNTDYVTIGSSGYVEYDIYYPSISSNTTYDITLEAQKGLFDLADGVPTTAGELRLYQYARVTVTLGLLDGANVYDDSELLDGSPNTAVTISGIPGSNFREDRLISKAFSYTIQPDMITAGSGSIAPKSSLSFVLDNAAIIETKLDGTSTTTTVDVDTTVGVVAGATVNWANQTKFTTIEFSKTNTISVGAEASRSTSEIESSRLEERSGGVAVNHNNLAVGMTVQGVGIATGTTITAVTASQITLSQAVTTTSTSSPLIFATSGITVSSVTDGNTLVLSQAIPLAQNDLTIEIGSSGTSSSLVGVSGGTVTQSGSNVIIAGNINVVSFGTKSETVKLDLNELITIS